MVLLSSEDQLVYGEIDKGDNVENKMEENKKVGFCSYLVMLFVTWKVLKMGVFMARHVSFDTFTGLLLLNFMELNCFYFWEYWFMWIVWWFVLFCVILDKVMKNFIEVETDFQWTRICCYDEEIFSQPIQLMDNKAKLGLPMQTELLYECICIWIVFSYLSIFCAWLFSCCEMACKYNVLSSVFRCLWLIDC